jgi:hypothetical protein
MIPAVEITFDCLPLRSIARFDAPLDADPEQKSLYDRIRRDIEQHGLHNTYYLHGGRCVFQLTNHPQAGMPTFSFEGTVLTDSADCKTLRACLAVELVENTCDWLTASVLRWFGETVNRAVMVEFDRYIASGDLQKTVERIHRMEGDVLACGGFVGMGL